MTLYILLYYYSYLTVRFGSIGDSSQYSHEQNMLMILTSSCTRPVTCSCAHKQKAMHYALGVGTVHRHGYNG